MDGYDGIRIGMQRMLYESGRFSDEEVKKIIDMYCIASQGYNITPKSTEIIPFEPIPKQLYEYLACKKMEGRSKGTISNYCNTLESMFLHIQKPVDQITHQDIWGYLLSYQMSRPKPVSNRTMDEYLGIIKYFFSWMVDIGYLIKNPTKGIAPIKYEKKERESMTRRDLIILINACNTKRERALITLLYATGCRISEIAAMKKRDINWYDKSITVFGKGKKYRTVYFNDQAEICLKEYLESRTDECPYVMPTERGCHGCCEKTLRRSVEKVYDRVKDKISVHVTPHIVRHTMATLAIDSGVPVTTVQALLGHEQLNTTMEYVDMSKVNVKRDYARYVV